MGDTLNICLGHQAFPATHAGHVDVFLTSRRLYNQNRAIFIDDAIWGPHGGALSEYAQLFWLSDNFNAVVGDTPFVRVFQYRRFVSRHGVGRQASAEYFTHIDSEELARFADDFTRDAGAEVFNRAFPVAGGMLNQFAQVHPLDDLLAVVKFLLQRGRITPPAAVAFLREEYLIPACNMGVFRSQTLKHILALLRPVADFLRSPDYVAREGYNRRSLGFIIERLNSFVILDMMRNGQAPQTFGNHIVISGTGEVPRTIDI
jgi:hypothetical protein